MTPSVPVLRTLVLAAVLPVLTTGCGYFYKAQLAGYVKDMDTAAGVDGVLVTVYVEDPGLDGTGADPVFATPTNTSGGQAGFYTAAVVWQNLLGKYGKEGDIKTLYLLVTHPDYRTQLVTVPNILAGETNNVPDVNLETTLFMAPTVRGRVVDVNGSGVNGVRMVLDLDSTADEDTDYIATTATVDGSDGIYDFTNVKWHDDEVTTVSDDETAAIRVDDPNYEWQVDGVVQTLAVQFVSGEANGVSDEIVATRRPRSDYTANLTGRIYFRYYEAGANQVTIDAIAGAEITLTYTDDDGAHTIVTQSNQNGVYTAYVPWRHVTPSADAEVPDGEDKIAVTLAFTESTMAGNLYDFADIVGYELKSWLEPNQVPDQIDSAPGT